jgi:tRNA A-37 threonylcarbamoyl transferase component Bud32
MADADWVKYKQIRGKPLPSAVELLGTNYRLETVLKQDYYAAVGLFEREDGGSSDHVPRQVVLKVYHTEPLAFLPLGAALGRFLCRREAGNLMQLSHVPGVPHLLGLDGEAGLVREYLPGSNLREYSRTDRVDAEFFPRLQVILADVHAQGFSHNDLSKPENIIVTAEGRPVLIDFQIATRVRYDATPLRTVLSRLLVAYMQRVDRYHLAKLHTRRRPLDFTAEERTELNRKSASLTVHGWLRRPYRALRHVVLRNFLLAKDVQSVGGSGVPAPLGLNRARRATGPASERAGADDQVGVAEDGPKV